MAGRGFGKTRSGAEAARSAVETLGRGRLALVAPTVADTRDVLVEGESGILAVSPPWNYPSYQPSKRRLTWPNGAIATLYSADEANRLRGPQHDWAWGDEICAWEDPETLDMLRFGLRLGPDPRLVLTTTPKPTPLLIDLIADKATAVTKGSTYANRANLPEKFFSSVIAKYEGTRLGRQEIHAEILDIGGRFFDMWDKSRHLARYVEARPHWTFFGGLDWGKADRFSFLLACVNEQGRVFILAEASEERLSNREQAQRICSLLESHGVARNRCLIYADPSMFPPKEEIKQIGDYQIREFQREGLICIPAINDRINGWSRVKEFLQLPDGQQMQIVEGACPDLIRTMPLLVEDDIKKDDVRQRPKQDDHSADALRYLSMSRPSPAAQLPPRIAAPEWRVETRADGTHEMIEVAPSMALPRELRRGDDKERLL